MIPQVPSPRQTAFFMVGLAFLFVSGGLLLQLRFGELGILLTGWLLLFVPAVLFTAAARLDFRETFSLRRPDRRDVLGALLVVAGGTPIAWFLSWLQSFVVPVPVELVEEVAAFLRTDDPLRLAWLLFLMALSPAITEEFVFRGVLLSGTKRHLSPPRLVLLNGVVFGIFHLSFVTAFRFLPTAWLGVLIAGVVWRTRSIWTGVLMHFVNNAVIVILVALPVLQARFGDVEHTPPILVLPLGILLLATGIHVLQDAERRRQTP
jgi:sodium transport system permease protein